MEITKEEEAELLAEHRQEQAREYRQECRDQAYYEWMKDNEESMKDEFISQCNDEFEQFCRSAFNSEVEK